MSFGGAGTWGRVFDRLVEHALSEQAPIASWQFFVKASMCVKPLLWRTGSFW